MVLRFKEDNKERKRKAGEDFQDLKRGVKSNYTSKGLFNNYNQELYKGEFYKKITLT